jgi:hypothetical protein
MAHLNRLPWWNRMTTLASRSWGAGTRRRPPTRRLALELLEDRWVASTVTDLDDAGPGSLRDAIATTPAGGTVDFQPGLTGIITIRTGGLGINKELTIAGPGADRITVSGGDRLIVFGVGAGGPVTIAGLTIAHGSSGAEGGAMANSGTLIVLNCVVSDSFAVRGAGISNSGTLTVINSTFRNNTAVVNGAGIYNIIRAPTVQTVINSTFADNEGCAISEYPNLTLIADNSTFRGNQAGICYAGQPGATILHNTILAGNSYGIGGYEEDVAGPVQSQGHNLIGDGSHASGFTATDLVGTSDHPIDPILGPLQDNGGPTPTMAPLLGSPAIDAGDEADAPPTDQRGAPRIYGSAIDIGAYEVQAAPAPHCAVTQDVLLPHHHQLVDVGLSVQLNDDADPSARVHVQVFGNDGALPTDADLASGTLQLRARRRLNGNGRVYLIVTLAADASGQSGFDVCSAVVPYDHSQAALAAVRAEAAAATAYYQDNQTAPPDYAFLGDGPALAAGSGPAAASLGTAMSPQRSSPRLTEPLPTLAPSPVGNRMPAPIPSRLMLLARETAAADDPFGLALEGVYWFPVVTPPGNRARLPAGALSASP